MEPQILFLAKRAISRNGSIAPVLTEPAVPTTRNGTAPLFWSATIAARSAATSIAKRASVGIQRIESVPSPNKSAAFWIHVCVSFDP